eukprot:4165207-Prorocentrum_lima.AAC.1
MVGSSYDRFMVLEDSSLDPLPETFAPSAVPSTGPVIGFSEAPSPVEYNSEAPSAYPTTLEYAVNYSEPAFTIGDCWSDCRDTTSCTAM